MMLRDSLGVIWARTAQPRATLGRQRVVLHVGLLYLSPRVGMGCAERRTGFGFVPWAADCGARPAAGHLGT